MSNLNKLLEPVSKENPCGDNLEDEASFCALEALTKGRPERAMGNSVIPYEPPAWIEVKGQSIELLSKTKDLRIVVWLIHSLLCTKGFEGFSEGIALFKGIVEKFWDNCYPALDPDDSNPALERNSSLMMMQEDSMLGAIRESIIVNSRVLGAFSYRHVEIASGAISLSTDKANEEPVKISTIDAAFMDCKIEELQKVQAAVSKSLSDFSDAEKMIAGKIGIGNCPNFKKLSDLLSKVESFLLDRLTKRGGHIPVNEKEALVTANGGYSEFGTFVTKGSERSVDSVSSREEVVRLLDKVCTYYESHEPSSPVPLLIQRAKQLVSKNFMDILEDLVPDGVSQASSLLKSPEGKS